MSEDTNATSPEATASNASKFPELNPESESSKQAPLVKGWPIKGSPNELRPPITPVLLLLALAGIACIVGVNGARERHKLATVREATAVLSNAVATLDQASGGDPLGEILSDSARGPLPDSAAGRVWEWAVSVREGANRVAIAGNRVAAAAAELRPDAGAAVSLVADAQLLTGNASAINEGVGLALSDASIDQQIAAVVARAAGTYALQSKRPQSAKARKADAEQSNATRRRLTFVSIQVHHQQTVGRQTVKEAQSWVAGPEFGWWNSFTNFVWGDISASVLRTLFTAGGIALIVLACTTPMIAFLKRRLIDGSAKVEKVDLLEYAPLALAGIPLLVTPLLIASVGGVSPGTNVDRPASASSSKGENTAALATALTALANAISQRNAIDSAVHGTMVTELTESRKAVTSSLAQATSALGDLATTSAETGRMTERFTGTLVQAESEARKRHTELAKAIQLGTDDLAREVHAVAAATTNLTGQTSALLTPMSGIMAQAWVNQCLHVRDTRKAGLKRTWSWLTGNDEPLAITQMPQLNANNLVSFAQATCEDPYASMTTQRLGGQ